MKFKSLVVVALFASSALVVIADERRAPPPQFNSGDLQGIFFDNLDDAFRGEKPTLQAIRKSAAAATAMAAAKSEPAAAAENDTWTTLVSAVSIEDEVKRLKLHYDSVVTTPAEFNSGGYLDARLDLTVLATLFAVINEYNANVRWKEEAAVARDLIARTAFNCKAGSTQVYNEAKLRKADLQDLLSGGSIAARDVEANNDWTLIADRSPLMEYAEALIESLEDATRDEVTAKRELDLVKRNAELLAMLGEVLVQEGMDQADDEDYAKLSQDMTKAAREMVAAIERDEMGAVTSGASAVRQKCDACHEQYR